MSKTYACAIVLCVVERGGSARGTTLPKILRLFFTCILLYTSAFVGCTSASDKHFAQLLRAATESLGSSSHCCKCVYHIKRMLRLNVRSDLAVREHTRGAVAAVVQTRKKCGSRYPSGQRAFSFSHCPQALLCRKRCCADCPQAKKLTTNHFSGYIPQSNKMSISLSAHHAKSSSSLEQRWHAFAVPAASPSSS